jgi:scyllo-inositol 2-dehydrogenase (NADP+)
MKVVVVGMGNQGRKRAKVASSDLVATVDPFHPDANYKAIEEVPLNSYEAALVCTPDDAKPKILAYLLANKKHVLVEKPLLGDAELSLGQLKGLAERNNVVCYTAYNHRFEPHIVRVKQLMDAKALGSVYLARFFYGNGTARDVRNSPWRDKGLGVLSDLGPHLLDLALFLFDGQETPGQLWCVNRFENKAPDHVLFGYRRPVVLEMEATLVSWCNTFSVDIYGELGSAHIHCLCKWGPSTLTLRKRVLPSGQPEESVDILQQPDPTWKLEFDHFLELCRSGGTNLANDLWIAARMAELAEQIGSP